MTGLATASSKSLSSVRLDIISPSSSPCSRGNLPGNSAAYSPMSISNGDMLEVLVDDMSSTSSKDFLSMVPGNFTATTAEEYLSSTNITSTVTEDCVDMTRRIMVDVGMARTANIAATSPLAKTQESAVPNKAFKQS